MKRHLTSLGEGAVALSCLVGCCLAVSFFHQQPGWMRAAMNWFGTGGDAPLVYDHWRSLVLAVSAVAAAVGAPSLVAELLRRVPVFSRPVAGS